MNSRSTANCHPPFSGSRWPRAFRIAIMGEMVQIRVDGFDGPIDLLLDLIDRQELNITALSLAEVADQYWRDLFDDGNAISATSSPLKTPAFIIVNVKSCALL